MGPDGPPLLSAAKITDFDTRLELLGWVLGTRTQELTVTMTPRTQQKLRCLLDQWPPSRTFATARHVAEQTGFLSHVSFALRLGKFFVGRLLAAVGMPQSAVVPSGVVNSNRRVVSGPTKYVARRPRLLALVRSNGARRARGAVFFSHVQYRRSPAEAYKLGGRLQAGRGRLLCRERLVLPVIFVKSRRDPDSSRESVVDVNDISSNALELLFMLVGAWLLVISKHRRSVIAGECVL